MERPISARTVRGRPVGPPRVRGPDPQRSVPCVPVIFVPPWCGFSVPPVSSRARLRICRPHEHLPDPQPG
jgi:hypothetical protein